MFLRNWVVSIAAAAAMVSVSSNVKAASIDLNDFFADPTVSVTADGSMATFAEDAAFSTVLLSNDPIFFGDPNVILPAAGAILTFDFTFTEGANDDDEFGFFVLDSDTGNSIAATEQFFTASTSGTAMIDLSTLVGTTLGFQFQLSALTGDLSLDSTAKVSNFQISAIPLPMTAWLLLSALGGLVVAGRRAQ